LEVALELSYQLIFTSFFIDELLVVLDDIETSLEGLLAVLTRHILRKFSEIARSDVDHFLLGVCRSLRVHVILFAANF
jgi:hypothetical protein